MKIKTKRGARRIRNQRVICKRFVVTDYTGCSYITAGKRYPLTLHGNTCEMVTSDTGIDMEIIGPGWHNTMCPHLNDVGKWRHPIT